MMLKIEPFFIIIRFFSTRTKLYIMIKVVLQKADFRSFSKIKVPFPTVQHAATPYSGIPYEQVIRDRSKYMPNFFTHLYKQPLLISEGHYQYIYDHSGNRYIDLAGCIATISVGHSHPAITKVVTEQVSKLTHTSQIYAHQSQAEYCKKLCEQLGEGFDNVYLCNSGGEANDFAAYLARLYTNEMKLFSLKNAFHGLVGSSANLTNMGIWNSKSKPGIQFQKLAWPNQYRRSNLSTESLINDAKETLDSASMGGKIARAFFEPIQGGGGILPPPKGYLPIITDLIRNKYGGLIISDEVQTGFGRVGTKYWGHRWQGFKPDIVTMAKSIGNGFALAAVVTRKEITDKITCNYFNTFGGGPIQCRVGLEVLRLIREQKLDQNVETVGDYLLTELSKLVQKYRVVGDVRGKGFMIGIQIVKDKESKEPSREDASKLLELSRERGLLFGKGGAFGNVIRLQPPYCLNMQDAKYTVAAFEDALINLK